MIENNNSSSGGDQQIREALTANLSLLHDLALKYSVARPPVRAAWDAQSLRQPEDVARTCAADMGEMVQEQLRVILLNTKLEVIDVVTVYQGTVNSASIRISEILRPAVLANAPSMIVVHNHPSGDPTPSSADILVTRKLKVSADNMDIDLLDHVVVARPAGHALKVLSMKRSGLGFDE